jgi:hypothetical protein
MNKLKFRLATWLLHSDGFQFTALKEKNGNVWVEGDNSVIKYLDIPGYFWKR